MSLSCFFRINLPYGIAKSYNNNQWIAFNREYKPLGINKSNVVFDLHDSQVDNPNDPNLYTQYNKLTDEVIAKIFGEGKVQRDDNGNIIKAFFYDDGTNPNNQQQLKNKYWEIYINKIRDLSKYQVK